MRVSVIIVGIGQWKKYTRGLLHSILEHNKDLEVIIVDNGGHYTSQRVLYSGPRFSNVRFVKIDELVSYATAINAGLRVLDNPDWVIILNNDVLCTGTVNLHDLRTDTLYGNRLHSWKVGFPNIDINWIDGWLYAIPYHIIKEVGEWDEKFKIAHAEDLDYCLMASKLGYKVGQSHLSFEHLGEHIRKTMPRFKEVRGENKKYLYEKHGL